MSNSHSLRALPTAARSARVVALVEDDRSLREAIARVLRASGFVAHTYASAEAALVDPAAEAADCVVLDLNLPEMSGLDLLERLRGRGLRALAVVITASDSARLREEVRRRGIEHLLAKPFGGRALVQLIDRLLPPHGLA